MFFIAPATSIQQCALPPHHQLAACTQTHFEGVCVQLAVVGVIGGRDTADQWLLGSSEPRIVLQCQDRTMPPTP